MFTKIAEKALQECVAIYVLRDLEKRVFEFVGSGFFAGYKNTIVTCAHILRFGETYCIEINSNVNEFKPRNKTQLTGLLDTKIIAIDSFNDLAVLIVNRPTTPEVSNPLEIAEFRVNIGTQVFYAGYPFGYSGFLIPKFSSSIISSKTYTEFDTETYQLDTIVHLGNSGGPLINQDGRVIGVVSGNMTTSSFSGAQLMIGNTSIGDSTSISHAVSSIHISELFNGLQ